MPAFDKAEALRLLRELTEAVEDDSVLSIDLKVQLREPITGVTITATVADDD